MTAAARSGRPRALAFGAPALAILHLWKGVARRRKLRGVPRIAGHCPLCGRVTSFADWLDNPRESPVCLACGSVPRQRALALVLQNVCPDWRHRRVHESSPSLATFRAFRRECRDFTASYFWPAVAPGARVGAFVNVDLAAQPFADASFDVVVTQDVLEHAFEPERVLREIRRTLGPGGVHVFTVPRTATCPTRARAELANGTVRHLSPAEYHRDPVARTGALVVTDWGLDLEARCSALDIACRAEQVQDAAIGVPAAIEVFAAR
ncbi:MAG: class I SAM-dependent methyltransferase [Planctomycetota bacterium]